MKKEPVKVSFIGKGEDNFYQIKFPNLQIPVNVNEELYKRMRYSRHYEFVQPSISQSTHTYSNTKEMLSV